MNILFISAFLSPNSKGGPALRAKNSLAILQQLGNVKPFDLETISRFRWTGSEKRQASEITHGRWAFINSSYEALYKLASRSLQIVEILTQIVSASAYFRLRKFIKETSPDVVWFSYASDYPRLFLLLRRSFPSISFVADTQAVVSTHLKRAGEKMSGMRGMVYRHIAREKLRHENMMMKEASVTTAVSQFDWEEYRSRSRSNNLALFPNVVSTSPLLKSDVQKSKVPTVLITGTFGGEEGAMTHGTLWFLSEVFPTLLTKFPNLKVKIVGRNAERIRELSVIPSEVRIEADVPSLDPYFSEAWCSACPLFFESGTRFKILEASERAIPTVSTTLGAEGLDFEHERDILIADEADKFAALLVRLLEDEGLRSSLGKRSRATVISKYSLSVGAVAAKRILEDCLAPS
jgi:glycosyltransferase involved in cell wall biosynthesis